MRRIMLFDRFDQPIGELSENEVFAATRTERVNGEHCMRLTTTRVLEQGWRVLTCDDRGKWREHVVYGTDSLHDSGERAFGDYYCVWSLQADLMGTRVSRMPGVQTPVSASVALGYAIEGTSRWAKGTVTNTNTGGGSMYDMDGWSAMSVLIANWGGEIDATIEVGSTGVTARKVDYYSVQGDQDAKRRYDFGSDLKSVRRTVADGPLYCRITPRGAGEESGDGYGRKITIESVNGGKDYLENQSMVDLAKLPDGSGGWEYPTLEVENSECTTPADLKSWGESVLEESTVPKITYQVDVLQLAKEGVDMHGVSLGDAVQVVDRKFGNGLRVSGRVLEMTVNLLEESDVQLVVGSLADDLASMFGSLNARLTAVTNTVQAMNGGTMSTAEYLSRLLERINAEVNATGGYTYITEGQGIRTYDVAVSDPLVGSEAAAVVEIKGGTIRIANTKTAQGDWVWKTVFTSGHIAASVVTAANITAGYIGSVGDTFIDLDNHTVQLGPTRGVHTIVDASGINMYGVNSAGNTRKLAFFGIEGHKGISRLGDTGASRGNVEVSSDGYVNVKAGNWILAHFGWDYELYMVDEQGNNVIDEGGYTDIGYRKPGTQIGGYSTAEGWYCEASRYTAHAEGFSTKASERYSHAEGLSAVASGLASHAEGRSCTASGAHSHAEGWSCTASGANSHAEGLDCTASGDYSHAEGRQCVASGNYSHAEGQKCTASGPYSHAQGVENTAPGYASNVCGRYANPGTYDLFCVGNGQRDDARANAFVVNQSNQVYVATNLVHSDKRVKRHIGDVSVDEACEFVRSLKPVKYEKFGHLEMGFYAQDVEETSLGDYLVATSQNHGYEDFRNLSYDGMIAPIVAYIQSLEARISELEGSSE